MLVSALVFEEVCRSFSTISASERRMNFFSRQKKPILNVADICYNQMILRIIIINDGLLSGTTASTIGGERIE
ncbi:hypothetical protein SAMN02799616_03123 [Paenibacillus sp. UNC499MF]|nr:hypothetical protein SAMN02799616_03123 [Paenibacillus sp. UNC499MF]